MWPRDSDDGRRLDAGRAGPDFALVTADGTLTALRDFRGAPVVLAFYPADWSPMCSDQMVLYNELLCDFERLGARIFGISVDGRWCHHAFAESRNLRLPLLADFKPKGEVARRYGVCRESDGTTDCALVVIDAKRLATLPFFRRRCRHFVFLAEGPSCSSRFDSDCRLSQLTILGSSESQLLHETRKT